MIDPKDLPYRPCVGVMLINPEGRIFAGQRLDSTADAWQMPQGGIDPGEDPYNAALRELYEETNVRSTKLLAEAPDWFNYDLPMTVLGKALKGRYRGQTQKWFALRFTGDESEIDVVAPGNGAHKPEFVEWRWERLEKLPGLIIPFKRGVYEQVVATFTPFAAKD